MNKNLPNLNAIRLFLSIVVIFFHIPRISNSFNIPTYSDLPILQKGTLAVYYFFTLSGFLIIRSYLQNKELLTQQGEAGYQFAKANFDRTVLSHKYISEIEKVKK